MYLRQFDFVNFWFFLDYTAPWGESSKWEVIKSLWDMKKIWQSWAAGRLVRSWNSCWSDSYLGTENRVQLKIPFGEKIQVHQEENMNKGKCHIFLQALKKHQLIWTVIAVEE